MLNHNLPAILLGSSSPRRKELLSGLGLQFKVIKPDFEEQLRPGELPHDYVVRNSASKAEAVCKTLGNHQDTIVICADTIVVLEGEVFEKPRDEKDAQRMLGELAGRTHTVMTGLTVVRSPDPLQIVTKLVTTNVTLKPLSKAAISAYVRTGEPLDKAGSYAIQGHGGFMVAAIHGSYSNVVGLPLAELLDVLEKDLKLPVWN